MYVMMSILEFLESRGVVIDGIEDRLWWLGWEDAHIMGRVYEGWSDLSGSVYEYYAELVCDFLDYEKRYSKSIAGHYFDNTPAWAVSERSVESGQRGGGYE